MKQWLKMAASVVSALVAMGLQAQAAADRIAGGKDNLAKVLEEVGDHPSVKK